jgi:hypothetical protein
MFQGSFDVMESIRSVHLSKGDRLIAESAARGAESAVDLLCRIGAQVGSAVAPLNHTQRHHPTMV